MEGIGWRTKVIFGITSNESTPNVEFKGLRICRNRTVFLWMGDCLGLQLNCLGLCRHLSRTDGFRPNSYWLPHWGTMHGGGGGKIGGIGPGDEFSYTTGLCASINHDSCCRPTATIGPRFRRQSIQQSANILCNRSTFKIRFVLFMNIYTTI